MHIQVCQHLLVKRPSFSSVCTLNTFVIDHLALYTLHQLLCSLFCSIDLCLGFYAYLYLTILIKTALQHALKSGTVRLQLVSCWCFSFFLLALLRIILGILGLLWLQKNVKIIFSNSWKNIIDILIGITLNLYIAMGSIDILIMHKRWSYVNTGMSKQGNYVRKITWMLTHKIVRKLGIKKWRLITIVVLAQRPVSL